jgi:DNA modification methylase
MLPNLELDLHTKNTFGTHNLHPYPAKFIPQIPARLIEALSTPGQTVLDPFCGSGTTLVEARRLGRAGYGSDINDLSVMIARSKSFAFGQAELELLEAFRAEIEALYQSVCASVVTDAVELPDFRNREHWFDLDVLRDLVLIRNKILQMEDAAVRNFLLVTLSAIVVRASRQDSETRWKAVSRAFRKGCAFDLFLARLAEATERISSFSEECSGAPAPRIFKADAKNLFYLKDGEIDLVVTSPPYLNSFDYYLYHKLRLFLLEIDHYSIQEAEIGSRNKHCDKKQSDSVYGDEMLAALSELCRVVKPSGRVAVVIGDAIYRGDLKPMDIEIEKLAQRAGFRLDDKFSYDQRRYTRSFTRNLKTLTKKGHVLLFSRA